jgi:hypothetical protein
MNTKKLNSTLESISQQLADIRERQAWILMNLIATQAGHMRGEPEHPITAIEILGIAISDSESFDSLVEFLRSGREERVRTTAPHEPALAHAKRGPSR